MTTQIKTSTTTPALVSKAGSDNNTSFDGYIPNGVLIAMILKALREAQNNDMERQQLQAETEQKFYTALGNLGGDPSKGVIAMAAQSILKAGQEQASGLVAMGISMAVNAGISGFLTAGTLGLGIKETLSGNSIEDEITTLKNQRAELEGPRQADNIIAEAGKENEVELDDLSNPDSREALKNDNQDNLESAKEKKNQEIKDKMHEKRATEKRIEQAIQTNQAITNISSSATQAAGNCIKAPHDAEAAANNAASEVERTLTQMDTSSANSFKENAQAAAQQALRTAEDLAQVAASQVQVRG